MKTLWMRKTQILALPLCLLSACDVDTGGGGSGMCSYGGKSYAKGATFPSLDGCNTCSCDGANVACTERACADVVMCSGAMPTFPSFDKTCGADGDCAIGVHQINCCGSLKALGLRSVDKARFEAAEQTCRMQYPMCRCPAFPTVAEDGKSTKTGDGSDIAVSCMSKLCTTYVK